MPTRERVQASIARVERGEHYDLMTDFYADGATAQENNDPLRVGLAAMMEHERQANERVTFPRTQVESVVIDGDRVAIHYVFDVVIRATGQKLQLDEIAYQLWRGEQIVTERYFYDPTQRRPR